MGTSKENKLKVVKSCLSLAQKIYPNSKIITKQKYVSYRNTYIGQYLIKYKCPTHGVKTTVANPALYNKMLDRKHWCLNCHTTNYLTRNPNQIIIDTNALLLKKKGKGQLVKCVNARQDAAGHIVTLKCPTHGKFELRYTQLRDNKSWTCGECYKDYVALGGTLKSESFYKALATTIYRMAKNEKYIGTWNKVKLICPIHSRRFSVIPNAWIMFKRGCSLCRQEVDSRIGPQRSLSEVNQILKNKKIECLKYGGSKTLSTWLCKVCGNKWSTNEDWSYVKGTAGCFKCNAGSSRGERELYAFVKSLASDTTNNHRIKVEGFDGKPKELDVFVPSKNIAFEYNGLLWHSTASLKTYGALNTTSLRNNQQRHKLKTDMCEALGIRLIHVWEHDWVTKRSVVESLIKNALGLSENTVYGRKTIIKVVRDKLKVKSFYNKYHIQGAPVGGITLGLSYNKKFVAMMTFSAITSERGKYKVEDEYELVRFATSVNVVGGASKLLKCFIKVKKPNRIVSYSDRQYFTGNLYPTLGFNLIHEVAPDYKVIWNNTGKQFDVRHKSSTTRTNLAKVFGKDFNPNETELANSLRLGLHRFYDAGKIKWEWLNTNTNTSQQTRMYNEN